MPLERAAEEAGIPVDEARIWAKKRCAEPDFLDLMMRVAAGEAMEIGIATLKEIAQDAMKVEITGDDDTKVVYAVDCETRRAAASDLAKIAIQILTKTKAGGEMEKKGGGEGPRDLFDAPRDMGPWKLSVVT